ncbi:MAG: EamA family transporter [Burkholderiaceae bacterium]
MGLAAAGRRKHGPVQPALFAGVRGAGIAVGTAVAIGSAPIWAGLLQALFDSHRPSGRWWLGTLVAVAGGVLLVSPVGPSALVSVGHALLCLLAGLAYAAYAMLNKRLVGGPASPLQVSTGVFSIAALLAAPVAWWLVGWPVPGSIAWPVLIYLGVVATGVSYLLFASGQRLISAATAVTLTLAEPVTAFVLATLLVGEAVPALAWPALVFLLTGMHLVLREEVGQARGS